MLFLCYHCITFIESPGAAYDLRIYNTTDTSISLSWREPYRGNSPILSYTIQYQYLASLLGTNHRNKATDKKLETADSSDIAKMVSNDGDRSAVALTDSDASIGIVDGNLMINELKLYRENVSGSYVASASSTSPASGSSSSQSTSASSGHPLSIKASVAGLKPNSYYRVRVIAENGLGRGDPSKWIQSRTEESAPSGPPRDMTVSATGPNSIKISWAVSWYSLSDSLTHSFSH